MKRRIAAALSIFAVVVGVGWQLARQPETSAGLQDLKLERSERSRPGPSHAVARVRVRVSPNDLDHGIAATADKVPQVSLAAE